MERIHYSSVKQANSVSGGAVNHLLLAWNYQVIIDKNPTTNLWLEFYDAGCSPGFVLRQLLDDRGYELAPQGTVQASRLEAVQAEARHGPLGRLPGRARPLLRDVPALHHPEERCSFQLLATNGEELSKK